MDREVFRTSFVLGLICMTSFVFRRRGRGHSLSVLQCKARGRQREVFMWCQFVS